VTRVIEKDWLTIDEVAAATKRNAFTVYRWVRIGLLPARNCSQLGAKRPSYRVHRSDVEKLVARLSSGLPVGT